MKGCTLIYHGASFHFNPLFEMKIQNIFAAIAIIASPLLAQAASPELRNGDLLFQANEGSFADAITDASARNVSLSFSHVAIVEVAGDSVFVIDAAPKNGVSKSSLADFLKGSAHNSVGEPLVTVGRIADRSIADRAVKLAESFIGQPYDFSFLPDNDAMYCSELVYECYVDANGKHIFKSAPMTFKNIYGRIADFWIELFKKRNEPIPEGVEGTSPNDMARDPAITPVGQFFESAH